MRTKEEMIDGFDKKFPEVIMHERMIVNKNIKRYLATCIDEKDAEIEKLKEEVQIMAEDNAGIDI